MRFILLCLYLIFVFTTAVSLVFGFKYFGSSGADHATLQSLVIPTNLSPYYTAPEINHLRDVRQLFRLNFSLNLITLIPIWIFRHRVNFKLGVKFTLVGNLVCLLIAKFIWTPFFIAFHRLFFPQGNWSFPADSLLIRLYPDAYWTGAFILIVTTGAIISFLLLAISRQFPPSPR
jgi:uncharacterized membrane protein